MGAKSKTKYFSYDRWGSWKVHCTDSSTEIHKLCESISNFAEFLGYKKPPSNFFGWHSNLVEVTYGNRLKFLVYSSWNPTGVTRKQQREILQAYEDVYLTK